MPLPLPSRCPRRLRPHRRRRSGRPSTTPPSVPSFPLPEVPARHSGEWTVSSIPSPSLRSPRNHDGRSVRSSLKLARAALGLVLIAAPVRVLAASPTESAGIHAKSAAEQFKDGNWEQALVEFGLAYEAVRNPDYLYNMAQCEYHLGKLKAALAHYQDYLGAVDKSRGGDTVELARARIKAINQRKSVFSIYSVPVGADVRIEGAEKVAGQSPSNFTVASGK